jgi:hypothetical protein
MLGGALTDVRAQAALALGSNLGDRLDYLQAAVDAITESPGIFPVAVSSVYETEPVGTRTDQPQFLNAVLVVDTSLPPRPSIVSLPAPPIMVSSPSAPFSVSAPALPSMPSLPAAATTNVTKTTVARRRTGAL